MCMQGIGAVHIELRLNGGGGGDYKDWLTLPIVYKFCSQLYVSFSHVQLVILGFFPIYFIFILICYIFRYTINSVFSHLVSGMENRWLFCVTSHTKWIDDYVLLDKTLLIIQRLEE